MEYINKIYPHFYEENDDFDATLAAVHEHAQKDIEEFIKKTCGAYEMPCLQFEINAPDL